MPKFDYNKAAQQYLRFFAKEIIPKAYPFKGTDFSVQVNNRVDGQYFLKYIGKDGAYEPVYGNLGVQVEPTGFEGYLVVKVHWLVIEEGRTSCDTREFTYTVSWEDRSLFPFLEVLKKAFVASIVRRDWIEKQVGERAAQKRVGAFLAIMAGKDIKARDVKATLELRSCYLQEPNGGGNLTFRFGITQKEIERIDALIPVDFVIPEGYT